MKDKKINLDEFEIKQEPFRAGAIFMGHGVISNINYDYYRTYTRIVHLNYIMIMNKYEG